MSSNDKMRQQIQDIENIEQIIGNKFLTVVPDIKKCHKINEAVSFLEKYQKDDIFKHDINSKYQDDKKVVIFDNCNKIIEDSLNSMPEEIINTLNKINIASFSSKLETPSLKVN